VGAEKPNPFQVRCSVLYFVGHVVDLLSYPIARGDTVSLFQHSVGHMVDLSTCPVAKGGTL